MPVLMSSDSGDAGTVTAVPGRVSMVFDPVGFGSIKAIAASHCRQTVSSASSLYCTNGSIKVSVCLHSSAVLRFLDIFTSERLFLVS